LENYVTTLIKNAKRKFPRQASFFIKKKWVGRRRRGAGTYCMREREKRNTVKIS